METQVFALLNTYDMLMSVEKTLKHVSVRTSLKVLGTDVYPLQGSEL